MKSKIPEATKKNVAIIIPVYNEAQVIVGVVNDVLRSFDNVICINDGSTDESAEVISNTKAQLVDHPINMGQGAALQTGIEYAIQNSAVEYFVTFDADGQHDIKDVKRMLDMLSTKNLDIVFGSRFLGVTKGMPKVKKLLLKTAIGFTNMFSKIQLTDTHNGLRVFTRRFAEGLEITMPDMAHASEIIDIVSAGKWLYAEVPITIHYTDYSKAKGQSMFNAINILFDLFLNKASRK